MDKIIIENWGHAQEVVITIDKLKIGIESQDDPNGQLPSSLKEFAKLKYDIIICSTRTSGSTVDDVRVLNKSDNYKVIWVTNRRSYENYSILNNFSAKQQFELISNILTNKI